MTGVVVLAAGRGRRFGGPKHLALLGGRTLLEHVLHLAAGLEEGFPVAVLRHGDMRGAAIARGLGVAQARGGPTRAESLRAGLLALPAGIEDALVLLADQPSLPPTLPGEVREVGRRSAAAWARPRFGAAPGHPVFLSRSTIDDWLSRPEAGPPALSGSGVFLDLPPAPWQQDVDTPADLEGLRLLEGLAGPAARSAVR